MTNSIALVLALLIIAILIVDVSIYGSEHVIFLGKRLYEFIEWIAFWR